MEGILIAILVPVVTGILVFISQWIYNKYFVLQPKIIIKVLKQKHLSEKEKSSGNIYLRLKERLSLFILPSAFCLFKLLN